MTERPSIPLSALAALLASAPEPTQQEAELGIAATQQALLVNHADFGRLYSALARNPTRLAEAQPLLDALLGDRKQLVEVLGARLLDWLLLGGTLSLVPASTAAPVAPSTPLSSEALDAYVRKLREPLPPPARAVAPARPLLAQQRQTLRTLLDKLGPLRGSHSSVDGVDEIEALEAVTSDALRKHWGLFEPEIGSKWVLYAIARTRSLKAWGTDAQRDRIKGFITLFPQYAREYLHGKCGHLNGLAVVHEPVHGPTWDVDAAMYLADLEAWYARTAPAPAASEVQSAEEEAVEEVAEDGEEEEDAVDDNFLATWPHAGKVVGSRVVVIGGEAIGDRRERVSEHFGFAKLEWVEIKQVRRVQSLVSSLENGNVDLVIFLSRWMSHKTGDAVLGACKTGKIPVCYSKGSGTAAIRLALESFFSEKTGAAS